MAYSISRARRTLETSFTGIAKTLRIVDYKATAPPIRDYVIVAGIVLAHSEIENYISDLLDAFAGAVKSKPRKGSELPSLLRAHLFIHKSSVKSIIGNLMAGGGEKNCLDAFGAAVAGPAGTIVNDVSPLMAISGADIYTTYKYPSKDNVKRLLQRLGVADPTSELNRAIRADAIALLESLAGLRTQLAHAGGTLPGVTPRDVRDRLNGVKKFVRAFDRVLYDVTVSHFGAASWRGMTV